MTSTRLAGLFFINLFAALIYAVGLAIYWVFFMELLACSICGYFLPILCGQLIVIVFLTTFALWGLEGSLLLAAEAFQRGQKLRFGLGIGLAIAILFVPFLADLLGYRLLPTLATAIYMLIYSFPLILLMLRRWSSKTKRKNSL